MSFFPSDINNKSIKPISAEEDAASTAYISPLDLNRRLIRYPSSTFFARVDGREGDLLIIEKGAVPTDGATVVVHIDGSFQTLRFEMHKGIGMLCLEDGSLIAAGEGVEIWGVVNYYIQKL